VPMTERVLLVCAAVAGLVLFGDWAVKALRLDRDITTGFLAWALYASLLVITALVAMLLSRQQ
jgi:hypothetical protein